MSANTATGKNARKAKRTVGTVLIYAGLIIACIIVLYPPSLVLSCSFKPTAGLVGSSLIPSNPTLANYRKIFTDPQRQLQPLVFNTLKISVVSALLTLVLTTPAAYAFRACAFRADGKP